MRVLLLSCLAVAIHGDYPPPRYTVDLSVAPEHRWDHIVAVEKDKVNKAMDMIFNSRRVKPLLPAARLLIGNAFESWRILRSEQYAEMKGIGRELGRDSADIVLVAAFYDLFASAKSPFAFNACTGIVAQTSSGEIFHGRNLDYDYKDALGPITIEVDFVRDNKTLFTAVTFGPNPTFDTVVRHGSFSITQNERDEGSVLLNMLDMIIRGRTATFATIRKVAETVDNFEDALDYLSKVKLSAASYFIIGGTKAQEGAVITRDRDDSVDVWRLNPAKGDWYVLELNSDHMLPPPVRDNRRAPLQRALNATGSANINASSLWDILSINKVRADEREPYNQDTIYTTVMQASNPKTFKTLVRSRSESLSVIV